METQDGTNKPQGDPKPGAEGTPKAGESGTLKKESYTPDEVTKLLADQDITLRGRYEGDIKTLKDRLSDQGRKDVRIAELEKQVDELLGVKDDPDLSAEKRRKAKDEIDILEKRLEFLKGEETSLNNNVGTAKRNSDMEALAGKYGVTVAQIKSACEEHKVSFDDSPLGVIEVIANAAANFEATSKDGEQQFHKDSGAGAGGGFNIANASAKDKIAEQKRRDKDKPMKIGGN